MVAEAGPRLPTTLVAEGMAPREEGSREEARELEEGDNTEELAG